MVSVILFPWMERLRVACGGRPTHITTHSNVLFYPFAPRHADIRIADIAHALARQCRFLGHTNEFYSVAQHSVIVSKIVQRTDGDVLTQLWGLLHDASEAYTVDVPTPIKRRIGTIKWLERQIMVAVAKRFDLPWPIPKHVHFADKSALYAEQRDLFDQDRRADLDWPCPEATICPVSCQEAEDLFYDRYAELKLRVIAA